MKKIIIDLLTFVFLSIIIILRILEKDSGSIGILTYISILIALYDLYVKVEKEFFDYGKKFLEIRGCFILIEILGTILFALIIAGVITLSAKTVDLLSVIALLISLPGELHCFLIGNFIKQNRRT